MTVEKEIEQTNFVKSLMAHFSFGSSDWNALKINILSTIFSLKKILYKKVKKKENFHLNASLDRYKNDQS